MSDAPPSPSADEHASGSSFSEPTAAGHEKEVSLLDILVVLARRKTFILGVTLGMALLGGGYSLLVAEEYTAEVKVVRESQSETPSLSNIGSLGALQGLGISLGAQGAASRCQRSRMCSTAGRFGWRSCETHSCFREPPVR